MGNIGKKWLMTIAKPIIPPAAKSDAIRKKCNPTDIITSPRFISRNFLIFFITIKHIILRKAGKLIPAKGNKKLTKTYN